VLRVAPAPPQLEGPPAPSPAATWTPLAAVRHRLEALCSAEVGIVRRTFRQLHDVDDVRVEAVGSQACESTALLGAGCNELNGGGHESLEHARAAAIGEGVERYSAAWYDPARLLVARPADLAAAGVDHVRPGELELFSAAQHAEPGLPFAPLEDGTDVCWAPGRDLADGTLVLVPAGLCFLAPVPWGAPLGYATSNGLAFHATWEEAVAGGLLELCERDAVVRTWYRRLSMPRLAVDDPALQAWLDERVAPTGLEPSLVDLTPLTGCPAVLAVIRNEATSRAPIALGAAAAPTVADAVRKAVVEGFQTRIWAKVEQRDGATIAPSPGFPEVRDFDDHVRLSLHPETVAACAFLDAGTEEVPLSAVPALDRSSPAALLDDLVGRLAAQDVRVVAVDASSPDVRESGFRVARVHAPRLQPLDAGYHRRFLGGRRLHDLTTFGYDAACGGPSVELNPWPHPFP
jgi:ribosomal protein S12 methylthiotransferase accessory factor